MSWRQVIEEGRRNHNVVTPALAATVGIARSTFDRRVVAEGWERPFPGVALLPGSPPGWRTEAAATLSYLGPDAALTRWWALRAHSMGVIAPQRVQVLLPATQAGSVLPGIEVVRSRVIPTGHVTEVDSLRVTTVARALTDLSLRVSQTRLRSLAIEAYHLDLAYPWAGVGVECLGWAYHHTRDQLDRDAARWNDIVTAEDWRILQLTWSMLFEPGWSRFVRQLRTLLASPRTPPA